MPSRHKPDCARRRQQHGAVSILAMLFLVIFSSLAAAMAIVAQGNLSVADSQRKINRSLAAAETGMRFLVHRLNQVTAEVKTTDGQITEDNAPDLWNATRAALLDSLSQEVHNLTEPYEIGSTLHVGPIAVGPGEPTFTATFTPHPIAGEDYSSSYYQRPPYSTMSPPVSAAAPLDVTWIRVKVTATDGPPTTKVTRSIQVDFHMTKKIEFAILSKSRVMIGRNVMIDGNVGSRFLETHLPNGHPVQMISDFRGISTELDDDLAMLVGSLITNDEDGDNRLNLAKDAEMSGIPDPGTLDTNHDGYIDDLDFFFARFDSNGDGKVSGIELDTANHVDRAQLLELIDTFGDAGRPGYNDGVIDSLDRYSKIQGQISITAAQQGWLDGAAQGAIQDYFAGAIRPDRNKAPLTFEAQNVHEFGPQDFDVTTFRNLASGDLASQATQQAALFDPMNPESPQPLGTQVNEEVPYGSAHPYDYYDRPVYKNMTFSNVKIPKGTNALFQNCKFIGCTFIESETNNTDIFYNYAGIQEQNGALKYPDKSAVVNGNTIANTKTLGNNLRFHSCTFEGSVVTDAPLEFAHVRNKLAFTGKTQFKIDDSTNLTDDQKEMFRRSTILAPHYSIELGTFVSPADSNETVKLSGTIVAGLIDMRGQVKITGTLMTTFEPKSDVGPVIGETSPNYNTTIGYFPSNEGDLESELPPNGVGVIQVKYDPTIPLPDGILGPISIEASAETWFEAGE